uniref:tripartite motif-containing protein 40 n=1 Tax=Halichoerus grypus TaxID=9711 RepID=UPI001659AAB8|nr:tripartite motif-containing protein 40 [Halichoerus grypus]
MVLPQEDGRGEGVCAICQELLKEAVSTECGHRFCRGCLARHVAKASASGVLCCPLCRKPCSEGVLGPGYLCSSHQKKVCYFCEESRLLVCGECLASPEHQGHCELAVGDAVNHYKERLSRRNRRLRRDLRALCRLRAQEEEKLWAVQAQVGCGTRRLGPELEGQSQSRREQEAPLGQWPDPLEDTPAPGARILDVSRAIAQLRSLVAALDKTAKGLGVDTLKVQTASPPCPKAALLLSSRRHLLAGVTGTGFPGPRGAERGAGEGRPPGSAWRPVTGWGGCRWQEPGNPL